MIKKYLECRFRLGKLHNTWLIQSDNSQKSLEELNDFIKQTILIGKILLENHPDFMLVERQKSGVNAKNISVDQIRELQEFLAKTSAMDGARVAIIYKAELMNLNAANSCLKILEDTPKNSYIFLITSKSSSILPTIRSRCAKINSYFHDQIEQDSEYIKFISIIADPSINLKLSFVKEFSDKNRELWIDFSDSVLSLINKIIKKAAGCDIDLNKIENEIKNKLHYDSINCLIKKYNNIKKLVDDTIDYDLDLKASCILLINEFT